ncbi:disease resistance protein PIK6-NP-like [Triticum dicoccoides]|uniref:Sr13 n=1 Tax=Triticum turgidum subsp. durum TaxID=4567 RepID=A0A9R0YZA2_TRITD|nr:disease resistance protein PIK6-NP-like [Triticum dicoccoides]VAI63640.1 unnamed protein product [Triticum turgidum subsp. durum]
MEAALVSAATGVLKPVLAKLASLLGDEYKHFKEVRKEIKFLMDELEAMHAFLLKMSEHEDPDVQDKIWAAAVRELSYDMEDTIDDFLQNVDDKDAKPDGFIEKIKHSLGKLGKMKTHHRIGSEIQDMKKLVIEVADRNARYRTISNSKHAAVDPRALAIFEHASKLVGIDEPKAEIIKLLTEGGPTDGQPKLVSIVGSGGMGKTTLANQVYQDLKEKFKCKAFISVSRNPDMANILRTILHHVSPGYANTEAWSIQQLISKINDYLANTRYFIVVDDIWDVKTWDVTKCAFPINTCGSILITTTRMTDVARSCCSSFAGHIYNMRPLDMAQSRKLFYIRLDSKEDCLEHLEEVCDKILEKCDGSPLAIIAISGLLANRENTVEEWDRVKNSIGRTLERNATVELMMKILSLSYFDLPPHLKTCLLYLSIFPEDYIIEKKDLIRRWIGEGFIRKESRYTLYELGQRYFNELINRSLVQPVKSNEYGVVMSCRVHDTILDFITSKSIEENFVTFDGLLDLNTVTQRKVRRLSLQVGNQGNSSNSLLLSHVRSINVFGYSGEIPSLDKFKYSRVLDFGGFSQLERHHLANIGRLFQLRHLNLRNTRINELSEQIGLLVFLQMLDIRGTYVNKLPASVANLRRLVYLLTDTGVIIPDGIAKMQALEILKRVAVFKQSVNFLQEVGQLKNMRKLILGVQVIDQEHICILGGLPALIVLKMKVAAKGNDLLSVSGAAGFPCLRELLYHKVLFGGMDLLFEPGSMPKLEKLDLSFNAGECHSLSSEAFDLGIGNLLNLGSVKCEVRGWLNSAVSVAKAYLEKTARTHPNRPTLLLA